MVVACLSRLRNTMESVGRADTPLARIQVVVGHFHLAVR